MRRISVLSVALAALVSVGAATSAMAVPLLQLDIVGGHYDTTTQTMVSDGTAFTLVAVGTPQGNVSASDILNTTYYISAAISPQMPVPGANLGSFSVDGQQVSATSGMEYGTPPVEVFQELQGSDPGDLAPHGVYPTYFAEFAFQFSPGSTVQTYNVADGSTSPGTSYVHQFVINTAMLDPRYVIHFDLYDETARRCGRQDRLLTGNDPSCVDVDVKHFAPFSHDAESSPPVPEPATMLLLGTGLAAGAARKYRNRRQA